MLMKMFLSGQERSAVPIYLFLIFLSSQKNIPSSNFNYILTYRSNFFNSSIRIVFPSCLFRSFLFNRKENVRKEMCEVNFAGRRTAACSVHGGSVGPCGNVSPRGGTSRRRSPLPKPGTAPQRAGVLSLVTRKTQTTRGDHE